MRPNDEQTHLALEGICRESKVLTKRGRGYSSSNGKMLRAEYFKQILNASRFRIHALEYEMN